MKGNDGRTENRPKGIAVILTLILSISFLPLNLLHGHTSAMAKSWHCSDAVGIQHATLEDNPPCHQCYKHKSHLDQELERCDLCDFIVRSDGSLDQIFAAQHSFFQSLTHGPLTVLSGYNLYPFTRFNKGSP